MNSGTTTGYLQFCLNRLRAGDSSARNDLLRHSQNRLRVLIRRMLSSFPRVRRFEDTDDVLNKVLLRIDRMFDDLAIVSVIDYLRLATLNIRRVLIDFTRSVDGPAGPGNHYETLPTRMDLANILSSEQETESARQGLSLDDWTAFHEAVDKLPEDERDVFGLLWYHELSQVEAAEELHISLSTLKRRWQAARVRLMELLNQSISVPRK